MAVAACRGNARDDAFEFGGRGRAAVGADVELRHLAVEQARDMAADRMGDVEHNLAVRRFQAVELGGQRVVVGAVIEAQPLRDRKSTRLNSSHQCAGRMPSSDCKKKKRTPANPTYSSYTQTSHN